MTCPFVHFFSINWTSVVQVLERVEDLEEKAVLQVEALVEQITKEEVPQEQIRIYDKWECLDAIKEIRDELESPFCCSRIIIYVCYSVRYLKLY